jgi:hypothetical protein
MTPSRWKPYQVIVFFGIVLCCIIALGVYFFDFFAGSATVGFGKTGVVRGTGLFYVYMLGFPVSLVVCYPIFLLKRFGTGALIFLPYAIIGFPVEYYYELYQTPALKGLWSVFGWCLLGLLSGLSADVAYRFLPARLSPGLRAFLVGCVLGAATFLFNLGALVTFYVAPLSFDPGAFAGLAYFGAPWLFAHSGFGSFCAWALLSARRDE